ncbi:MAG: hypothetical protein RBS48_06155 [Ignavibacteriaceae bacterium]|jgi:hypothetical protein|nr:hypothetical protein [Ignavibacteriaceae bacterium]
MSVTTTDVINADAKILALGQEQFNDTGYDLSELPIKDDSTLFSQEVRIEPVGDANLTNRWNRENEMIEFSYNNINDIYIPSEIQAKIEFTCTTHLDNGNAQNFADATDVVISPHINIVQELVQRHELMINNERADDNDNTGKCDSILKLTHTVKDWSETNGTLECYYPEYDAANTGNTAGTITLKRRNRILPANGANSRAVHAEITLPIPFWRENKKYLKMPFTLRLYRANNNRLFHVSGNGNACIPRITVTRFSLIIPTIKPNLQQIMSYDQQLLTDYMLQYTSIRSERRVIPANQGEYNGTFNFKARPSKVIIAFQDQTRTDTQLAVQTVHACPYIYDNLAITFMEVSLNGSKIMPTIKDSNFTTGDYVDIYRRALQATGSLHSFDGGSSLTYENFGTMYPLFIFDTKNSNYSNIPEINKELTDFRYTFRGTVANPVYMYVICLYDTVMSVKGGAAIVRKIYGD